MACARSGSIFCWPRAVVFFLRELECFVLLLWAVTVVPDFGCFSAEEWDVGCAFAEEDELAFEAEPVAFACVFETVVFAVFGVFASPVWLAGAVVLEVACAKPRIGENPMQISPKMEAAANHPLPVFARRFGCNGNPSRFRRPDLAQEYGPRAGWHCNHPLSDDATPVPVGSFQVTEVSQARRSFHLAAMNLADGPGTLHPDRSSGWTLLWQTPLRC